MGGGASREFCIEDLPKCRQIHISKSWKPQLRIENPLFLDENSKDVVILVDSTHGISRYPCHRVVLRKYIPALDEEYDACTGEIYVNRYTAEVVEQVLRSVYQKPVFLEDWKTARDILKMAKNYGVDPLINECKMFLDASITLGNVCHLLELSLTFHLTNLKKKCKNICVNAGFVMLKTKAFGELPRSVVREITSAPDLNVKNEMSVFEALWDWSKLECARANEPLTEQRIFERAFVHVADCVGFEFMTEHQKIKSLPMEVQNQCCTRICVDPSREQLPENLLIKRPRSLRFFSNINEMPIFFEYQESLLFMVDEPLTHSRGSHVSCITFSLNVDTLLLGFTTLCLYKSSQNKNSVEKLRVDGSSKILLKWENAAVDSVIEQTETRRCTVSDINNTAVMETHFKANAVLQLKADIVYRLEIEPCEGNVEWPKVFPHWDDSKFDRNISIYPENTVYGLRSISFLQSA